MIRKYNISLLKESFLLAPSKLRNVFVSLYRVSKFNQPPIIIGGCGRTGTSLMSAILDAHPHIFCYGDETYIFSSKPIFSSDRFNRWYRLLVLYALFLRQNIPASARRWCEKTPINVSRLEQILSEFGENIKVIIMIRDGRDVVTSIHPSKISYYVSFERWVQDTSLSFKYEGHKQIMIVPYERLITDFKYTMKKICNFLKISFDEKVCAFDQYTSIRKHSAWSDGLQPLHPNSIQRWTRPEHQERISKFNATPGVQELQKKCQALISKF